MIDEDVVIVAAPDLEEALADPELSGFIRVDVVNGEVKSTVFPRDETTLTLSLPMLHENFGVANVLVHRPN
jgi:hypothetical protein